MKHLIEHFAQLWHLSPAQYWHLRIVSALSLVPTLAVLYLLLFSRRRRRLKRGRRARVGAVG